MRFGHLDFNRLVGKFGSDKKFIKVCNRKMKRSYPNHKCITAVKGSVVIHFQGDKNFANEIRTFCSAWETEEILKDSAFASKLLNAEVIVFLQN